MIEYGTAIGTYGTSAGTLAADGTLPGSSVNVDPSVLTTATGVSIYVRVTIQNDDYEGLGQQIFALAVDAVNAEGTLDVDNTTCIAPALADFIDVATQHLNPRPTVAPVAPGVFIPKK